MAEGAFCNLFLCAFLSLFFGLIADEVPYWGEYFTIILHKSGHALGKLYDKY